MEGIVEHLFIKPGHGQPMAAVSEARAVADQGLEGDAAFGARSRQVLLVDAEVLERLELRPGQTRENVTVRGLALSGLGPGARLSAGPVVFELIGDCAPCEQMDDLRPGLRETIRGQRGMLARVVRGGVLKVGDRVRAQAAGETGR